MAPRIVSWLRETTNLLLQYLAVGVSFIPAGLLYVAFRILGWESPLGVMVSLAFGFLTARSVLNWLERKKLRVTVQTNAPLAVAASLQSLELPGRREAQAIAYAYFWIISIVGPTMAISPHQLDLGRSAARPATSATTAFIRWPYAFSKN